MEKIELGRFWRWCVAIATVCALSAVSLPTLAEPGAGVVVGGDAVEEIRVTGTRIARSNLTEYSNLVVVSSEELELTSTATLDELLRNLPSVTMQGINKNDNNGGNGLAFIDLRNMGIQRTLVLVNGRRFVTNGTGVSEAVDLNNIPVPMIERVEVLPDGASAVYGSDAVGGVVNIILKDDFEGLQLDMLGGIGTGEGDAGELGFSATFGANHDRGNITFNVTYLNRDEVEQKDREWSRYPVVWEYSAEDQLFGSSSVPAGRALDPLQGELVVFEPDVDAGTDTTIFGGLLMEDQCGPEWGLPPGECGQRYNYGNEMFLIGDQERWSINAIADFEMFDFARMYLEGSYTNRDSVVQLAPQPIGLSGTSTFLTNSGMTVPITNPYMSAGYLAKLLAADPTATVIPLYARRMTQVGNRITQIESDTFRVLTGFDGDLSFLKQDYLDTWKWEAFLNFGRNQSNQTTSNSINLARLNETADPAQCGSDINAAKGCEVADLFGRNSLTDAVLDYIRYTDTEVTGYQQFSYGLDLGGEIIEIPWGGPIALVLGYEHRDEEGFNRPSAVTVSGETAGNGIDPTEGGYKLNEFFGEVSFPLLSELPGAEALTADVAFRYSKYDTFGSDTTYRIGLSYAPVKDLRLRGIYNTVFRAPTITDLFGGAADSYESLSDPCNDWDTTLDPLSNAYANCRDGNGIAAVPPGYNQNALGGSQFRTNIGGNPNLTSETGDIWSAGVVFTPTFLADWLENFSLTVDYYNIQMDDAIDNPEPQFILDDCYDSTGLSSATCGAITRDPTNGLVNNLEAFAQNLSKIETSGVDINMEYELDLDRVGLDNIGIVDLGFYFNYLIDYTEISSEGTVTDFTGTLISNSGIYAEVKWAIRLGFRRDDWSLMNTVRYLGEADILEFSGVTDSVPSVTYWDIAAQYNWNSWAFTAGMDNVLDKDPPFFPEGGLNANSTYDFVGRFFWGRISYKF